jgi:hypothetical protein
MDPSALLIDGTHLNDYGNFIMAELVKPLFTFRPQYPADPFGLCTTYLNGRDFNFYGDTLTLPFHGNKADVIVENSAHNPGDALKVLVNGKPPSTYQGCYFLTRPYNDTFKKWPWKLPAMIRIQHSKPWISEEWTCTFTRAEPPYSDFGFAIAGSVTGEDGEGTATSDFISPSGRIIIHGGDAEQGGDWHLNRSYRVLKTLVNPGDQVRWKTYSIGMDTLVTAGSSGQGADSCYTLFQGIPNTSHTLQLIRTGEGPPLIKEIRIYKPFLAE